MGRQTRPRVARRHKRERAVAPYYGNVDKLTAFGLFAVTAGVICYALEERGPWFILAFAVTCALGSVYGFLQGAWPFGMVEIVWTVVALRRWWMTK